MKQQPKDANNTSPASFHAVGDNSPDRLYGVSVGIDTFVVKMSAANDDGTSGIVKWLDKDQAQSFTSFIELLHLLKEGIRERKDLNGLRSWTR